MRTSAIWTAGLGLCATLLFSTPAWSSAFVIDHFYTGAQHGSAEITFVSGSGSPPGYVSDPSIGPAYGGNDRLRLTSNAYGQRGNAWFNAGHVVASEDWTADIEWQMTYGSGGGADGMAFHMQAVGIGADTFIQGQGLGSNFLSVVFRTWNSGGAGDCGMDFALGVYNNTNWSNPAPVGGSCVDLSGLGGTEPHSYKVEMTHTALTDNLAITVTNTNNSNTTGVLNFTVDLSELDEATPGFSAQTGASSENHDVLSFQANFAVPEPGTAVLMGLGLMGLGWAGRARTTRGLQREAVVPSGLRDGVA
ncbi:PEP-CTERM sorting domain-containing protein [Myxococcota bacterium]|nr:PEP-CTERM sorting domain-containing protein [Myxococcota bacterium]